MGTARISPAAKKRSKAARSTPQVERPPFELNERGKKLWALLSAARKSGSRRLSDSEVDDLIDGMRDR